MIRAAVARKKVAWKEVGARDEVTKESLWRFIKKKRMEKKVKDGHENCCVVNGILGTSVSVKTFKNTAVSYLKHTKQSKEQHYNILLQPLHMM